MKYSAQRHRLQYCLRHPLIRAGVIVLLALVSTSLIVLLAWWGPMKLEQVERYDMLLSERQARLEAKRTAEISGAYAAAKSSVAQLQQKLRTQLNQAQAVQIISQLAAKQKIRVLSQAFETDRKPQQAEVMYIDLVLLGSYKGVRNLLAELPEMTAWIEVLEAHIEQSVSVGAPLKARLTLAVYHDAEAFKGRGGK